MLPVNRENYRIHAFTLGPNHDYNYMRRRMSNWFEVIAKRTEMDACFQINNTKIHGSVLMWGDEGIPMFTPHNKQIIYTDKSRQGLLRKCLDKRILRKIRFVENLISKDDINANKQYYKKEYDKSRFQQVSDWDEWLKYYKEAFNSTLWEIKKYEKLECWSNAIRHASRLYTMAKDLGSLQIAINTKIEAMIIKSRNELKAQRYYDVIHSIKRGVKYKQNYFHLNQFKVIYQNVNAVIFIKFNLKYDIKRNMMYFNDDNYTFNERGFAILKQNKYKTTKQKIRERKQKNKKCVWCHLIANTNKKCKGCKLTFYCNRYCQKKHWINGHKLVCH